MGGLAVASIQKLLHKSQLSIHGYAIRRPACPFAQQSPRLLQIPRLTLQDTQQKKRVGMSRIQRQHLLIQGSGSRLAARAVVFGGNLHDGCQQLCNGDKGSGQGTGH